MKRDGYVEMACVHCAARITTREAAAQEQIPDGIRFLGVPCRACGNSFTIELTKKETADGDIEQITRTHLP